MSAAVRLLLSGILFLLMLNRSLSWDNDELELFDLVEEVNNNFYDVLGVDQDASSTDIRKAYRKLTLQLHPDKNKAEDAEERFRQLVAVYEVLKDEEKRQKYNRVLVDGLPDWRTPVFYYRRARKMGFIELFAVLALIITIGQYLLGWAVYIERWLTLEDMIDSKKKKERKKKNKVCGEAELLEEEMATLPWPSILDLWPFRLPGFLYWCVGSIPHVVCMIREAIVERYRRKQEEEEEGEEDGEFERVIRKPKRRKVEVPEYSTDDFQNAVTPILPEHAVKSDQQDQHEFCQKLGEWSEEELILLAKAVNKFPGGTPKRWEKIASMVGRSVDEVCSKSKDIKDTYTMNLSTTVQGDVLANTQSKMMKKNQYISDNIITTADYTDMSAPSTEAMQQNSRNRHRPTKIPKTLERTLLIPQSVPSKDIVISKMQEIRTERQSEGVGEGDGGLIGLDEGEPWTQNQQVIFEWALRQFPKGTEKRWDRISEQIPGKTKADCIVRFKYLAEMVKKRKGVNQQI